MRMLTLAPCIPITDRRYRVKHRSDKWGRPLVSWRTPGTPNTHFYIWRVNSTAFCCTPFGHVGARVWR